MPTTPKGLVYPDSSGHTRIWEHLQTLASGVDSKLGIFGQLAQNIHLQEYAAGNTNAAGFRNLTHTAGWTPSGALVIPRQPGSYFATFWGADNYTSSAFRARFATTTSTGPLVSQNTGSLLAVLFRITTP